MPAPQILYGTAWKEDQTERLTLLALKTGFRGIDTANQRRHYFEEGVGAALSQAIAGGIVRREEIFLQTKFTSLGGQDHRLPYDRKASPALQVRQSLASSLEHLRVDSVDSYVLHGPSQRRGLSSTDHEVWQAMEALHSAGAARNLGISNVALDQLEELLDRATVHPAFVQNRCYARLGWDREVRLFCRERGVVYQGFSLLTANVRELQHPAFQRIVKRVNRTAAQVVFRFAMQAGMLPLTGTTSAEHMRQDLAIHDFELSGEEMHSIETLGHSA